MNNPIDEPDRMDADLALVTLFPEGVPTVDGQTYLPSAAKFLAAAFKMLAEERLGVADGATFIAFTGMEEAAADRLAELFGGES